MPAKSRLGNLQQSSSGNKREALQTPAGTVLSKKQWRAETFKRVGTDAHRNQQALLFLGIAVVPPKNRMRHPAIDGKTTGGV